ncbi:MAG TPA: hypothetical protein VNO24_20420 [Blastocatellia bacterium]|nr:hypothetical protein [Blastocatellia bacterium]
MFKNITLTTIIFLTLTNTPLAQTSKTSASAGSASASAAALAYFENVHNQSFDNYLKRIRPGRLSPELKGRVLAMLRKEDLVSPSAEGLDKLVALEPVLKYHDRSSVIDPKVIRVGQAVVMFLAGAAVLISQEALDMLTAEELQAVVAHELGHEYFWNEYEQARQNKQYDKLQELELRCDGMAVITMSQLGLDPFHFISAITKLTKSHKGKLISGESYTSLDERIRFIREMVEMVKSRERVTGTISKLDGAKQ